MKQEDIELLLKDLSARVPYVPDVNVHNKKGFLLGVDCNILLGYEPTVIVAFDGKVKGVYTTITDVKPYLRPMSSMTNMEVREYIELYNQSDIINAFDFLNSHHLDYRDLIEKGLALEAPEDMYKFE